MSTLVLPIQCYSKMANTNSTNPHSAIGPASTIALNDVPTKTDASPIHVVVPETVDGIYWLDQKIPVEKTFRFQGYFADKFPWVAKGVQVSANSFKSDVWVPKLGQKNFTISHDGHYPVTYQVPGSLRGGENMLVRAHLYGWGGTSNYCENFGDNHGYISIRNCASEYPKSDTTNGMSMWAFYGGHPNANNVSNENGERVAESLLSVSARHAGSIDHGAGFTLAGNSYGGTGSILLSMTIPRVQKQIAVVDAMVPITLFIKHRYPVSDPIQRAWNGVDLDVADFRVVGPSGKVDHVFYRLHGGSKDTHNNDTLFYKICNDNRIACLGTWHGEGHAPNEAGLNLPANLYPGDANMQARLDTVLPVFTNSTANSPLDAPRGHYNLGLTWNTKNILDSAEKLVVPLKYKAFKDFSKDPAKAIPDMPENITASVTLRRSSAFAITPGETLIWTFGNQTGSVKADESKLEVTIDGLKFTSSANRYTKLEVQRQVSP